MKKLEYILWFARAGINQLAPYLLVFYFTHQQDLASIAGLAGVFAAVGLANLIRSGALLSTVTEPDLRAPLWMEFGYSLAWTLPLILLIPPQGTAGVGMVAGIVAASGISGVFAARIDQTQGLSRLAKIDMVCAITIITITLALLGITVAAVGLAFLVREIVFCLAVWIASLPRNTGTPDTKPYLKVRDYVNPRLGGTLFWAAGPWKDFVVTNVGLACYSKHVYGAFYSTQLYWSLPVLVLGLLMRPAYKDVQAGRLSIAALRNKILLFVATSGVMLGIANVLLEVTPATSSIVQIAVLVPLLMAAPVTAATLAAVAANDKVGIIVQNILWGATACVALYVLKDFGFTGIAWSMILMNLASAFILFRKNK